MFGLFGSIGLPPMGCDPDEERAAPTAADIPDFPVYAIPPPTSEEDEAETALKNLYHVLASIRKPQDINNERFRALNLAVETNVPVAEIVHQEQRQQTGKGPQVLPRLPWEEGEYQAGYKTSNAYPYPDSSRFEVLRTELLLDDDAAFREVTRMAPREGNQRVRITQTRKFWTSLERLAQYWDTRLDKYYERSKEGSTQEGGGGGGGGGGETEKEMRYTGRRVGAGHEMPEEIREELVRGFLEMAAWPFGCQVMAPSLPPRLTVNKTLLFPVRVSVQAARSPQDRMLARSGLLEGPMVVAQCRPETAFRTELEPPGSGIGEVCDLYREVGAMLLGAQERAREGATEVLPGEGKWWTTVPRWGQTLSSSHHYSHEHDHSHSHSHSHSHGDSEGTKRKYDSYLPPRRGRKISNADKWKMVQPGPSLWDRRMRYQRIGTDDSAFDDVYMLSSINHHLAILHLRVHHRYLEIVSTGEGLSPAEVQNNTADADEQPWYVLRLRRTRWYNLLDGRDRVEALQGVWQVFHYMMRPCPGPSTDI